MSSRTRAPYVGRTVERLEDQRLLRGRGCYVDDIDCSGVLHAVILRSSVAHGHIRSIDASAARAMPGVHAVLTADDLPGGVPMVPLRMEPHPQVARYEQPVIAQRKVRYVGEPLAVVVADTPALAEDALSGIAVAIEPLPAVTGWEAAIRDDVLLFEEHGTNQVITLTALRGEVDEVFRTADYTRKERFAVHRHTAVPMETRGLLAEWDAATRRLRVSGLMKVPFAVRAVLARLLALPEDSIEGVETDVGAGFGMRGEFYPEDFLVPYLARALVRPVKWIEDRREHLLAITHAREAECELEIACRRDGTLLGLRGVSWFDTGAYVRANGMTGPRNLAQMIPGPYRIGHLKMEVRLVVSNKTPSGSYRGPGRYEADFFRERLIDLAAADLGIDRVAMRRMNLLTEADMPFSLGRVMPWGHRGATTDTGDYRIPLDRCLQEIGWQTKMALQGRLVDGRYHGLAVGCYLEGGSMGPSENARVVLEPDGAFAIYVGSSGVGQGIETIFAQIAADALGVPIERIRGVFHGSTGYVKLGFGSGGSRSTVMGGSAILDAAANLKRLLRETAAAQFGCLPDEVAIIDDLRTVSAGGRSRSVPELAVEGLSAEGRFDNDRRTYSYGTHAAHVAVDPATGHVQVLDYVSVEDVGRIINPATLHGQVVGAILQGLGATLMEELVYDAAGQLLTGSLASYLVPAADDYPVIRAVSLEMYPSPISPLGAKGAGEGGIIPVGGVIANAVAAALGSFGVQPNRLPLTPPRVWQLIASAGSRPASGPLHEAMY
ncbi:MAG: xanthine dehydrogenase family protein molybdopterin-binding subunit [bacterium]|jgi:carbon-monoxide dehydrogenase large subunit|nr:xanthine dehydrogenase family protein molybdopterin-binding subunit [Betaproteobacteria bacterium]